MGVRLAKSPASAGVRPQPLGREEMVSWVTAVAVEAADRMRADHASTEVMRLVGSLDCTDAQRLRILADALIDAVGW